MYQGFIGLTGGGYGSASRNYNMSNAVDVQTCNTVTTEEDTPPNKAANTLAPGLSGNRELMVQQGKWPNSAIVGDPRCDCHCVRPCLVWKGVSLRYIVHCIAIVINIGE